jgi:GMP synthase (glutamine-hydrolysing)
MTNIYIQRILILDFGSQYTQLIARRVRELGVYCEIHPYSITDDDIKQFAPVGVILSGGPESVNDCTARIPDCVLTIGCPILGICYGMQAMAVQLGGQVESGKKREFGYAQVVLRSPSYLLNNIEDHRTEENQALLDVWMSHGDHVSQLPLNFVGIASTEHCEYVGMADENKRFYGLQFHPEVSHTLQGKQILSRFVIDICGCTANWNASNIIQEQIAQIQKQVGHEKVLLGLSGGVDSSVAALLIQKAIGKQLICVFVDTGLLRLNEAAHVKSLFEKQFELNLICIDASEVFLKALQNESDPEKKRRIIGQTFIEVFEQEALKHTNIQWLAQGTIYSDVIESAASSGKAHVIKSHHNVGGLPDTMNLKLLEPLRELFKDEVREVGAQLGLPPDLIHRHPFPGPGLGVRILGEILPAYIEKLRLADAILIEELYKANLYQQVSQAFAVFLPIKSVGVIGDARHYDHVIAIRVVETIDFMTATWARLPYAFLEKISNRIINEVPGISRVTYDISSKPPATIEWE